jgi:hypothetical protein
MRIATTRVSLMALTLVLGLEGTTRADLLYNTTSPDNTNPAGSLDMTGNNVAANFGLSAPATITDIRFWSWEGSPGYTGSITWSIYQDNNGTIGATMFSETTSNVSHTDLGNGGFDNDIPVSVPLGAGIYWLGLHNGPLSNDSNGHMLSAKSMVLPRLYAPQTYDLAAGGPWVSHGGDLDLAFALYGQQGVAAPEPSTLIVGGLGGLLWLGYVSCRRRAA